MATKKHEASLTGAKSLAGPVQRVSLSAERLKTATSHVTEFVSARLRDHHNRWKVAGEQINALQEPFRETLKQDKKNPERLKALHAALKSATEGRVTHRKPPPRKAQMEVHPGDNFLSPPWDYEWYSPNPTHIPFDFVNGWDYSETAMEVLTRDSYNGSIVGNGGSGDGSAGMGVFLSSPIETPVSIRPFVPYDYHWDNDSWGGFTSQTSGGIGLYVFQEGNPYPVKDLHLQLWSDLQSWGHNGDSQNGYLQNLLENYEIAFTMSAGSTYNLGVYIWGHADCSGEVADLWFLGTIGSVSAFHINANLDFLVIKT